LIAFWRPRTVLLQHPPRGFDRRTTVDPARTARCERLVDGQVGAAVDPARRVGDFLVQPAAFLGAKSVPGRVFVQTQRQNRDGMRSAHPEREERERPQWRITRHAVGQGRVVPAKSKTANAPVLRAVLRAGPQGGSKDGSKDGPKGPKGPEVALRRYAGRGRQGKARRGARARRSSASIRPPSRRKSGACSPR